MVNDYASKDVLQSARAKQYQAYTNLGQIN